MKVLRAVRMSGKKVAPILGPRPTSVNARISSVALTRITVFDVRREADVLAQAKLNSPSGELQGLPISK